VCFSIVVLKDGDLHAGTTKINFMGAAITDDTSNAGNTYSDSYWSSICHVRPLILGLFSANHLHMGNVYIKKCLFQHLNTFILKNYIYLISF
jgi:hypothetical protein